jgi:hypothetical protein
VRYQLALRFLDIVASLIWRFKTPATVQLAACRFIDTAFPLLSLAYGDRGKHRPLRRASMLNRMLCTLTRIDPNFTLHTRFKNGALLHAALAEERGALICTAHLRLTFAAHRALRDLGLDPAFVGLAPAGVTGWNWGDAEPLTKIDADRADVLIRCSQHLRAGGVVIAFVDYHGDSYKVRDPDQPLLISPNAFTWAANNGVPLLFMATRLEPDGRIVIEFDRPSGGPSSAAAFAAFIERRTGWTIAVKRPKEQRNGVATGSTPIGS